MVRGLQVEFFGGLAVSIGFLSPLAALGLFAVSATAAWSMLGDKLPKYPIDAADTIASVRYMPEVLYLAMAAAVVLADSRACSSFSMVP